MASPDRPVSRLEIFGWSMYDFANSSYTTVIVTVAYAVVFAQVVVGPDDPTAAVLEYRFGNLLWSIALSISYGITVLTLPLVGAVMDHVGHKKRFLFASTALTVGATALLYFASPGLWPLALVLIVLSNVGFSLGESFIAAFLPDLGPPEALGRISGFAWGFGYVGGLLSTGLVIALLGAPVAENWGLQALIGPVTALWFGLAAVPTFLLVRDRGQRKPLPAGQSIWTIGLSQSLDTWRHLRAYRDLMVFFLSYLFAMAGLSIVVAFAFIYGEQVIGWSNTTRTLMFVITQISATLGALGFGLLQGRLGDKPTYALTLVVWVAAVVLIWGTPGVAAFLNGVLGASLATEQIFLGVGAFAGLCIGSTQSAGRTMVALYSPREKIGEFFGLWGVFGKLAAIFGLLALGGLQAWLGLQTAILVTGVFFALGLVVVLFVDDARARRVAASAG